MHPASAISLGFLPAFLLIASANATSPPPTTTQALTEFYQVMDGSNWKRRDNWLDPDIHYCHWHGISCYADGTITSLRLPGNRLAGTLSDTRILDLVERLDLSDNRVRGPLPPVTPQTRAVNLSHNLLEGNLPEMSQGRGESLLELQLADNNFSGEVPGSWAQLQLFKLDLSNNQLSGSGSAAFEAMDDRPSASIYLAGNAFAGALPTWLTDYNWTVNLCWTGFDTTEPGIADWVAEHHVGGPGFDIHSCTDRNRVPVGIGHSGSWFKPERSGEGFSLMLLDNGAPAIYWFSHISKQRQMWLFKVGSQQHTALVFPRWLQTRGRFRQGFDNREHPTTPKGQLRLDAISDDLLHGQYLVNYINFELDQEGDNSFSAPVPMPQHFLQDHVRLSRLAGSRCDNQLSHQWISGIWYQPLRNGEGFVVEVNEQGRGLVYWFTYTPDGEEQAWLVGDGEFDGATLSIETMIQPRDTGLAMPFDTAGIEHIAWGSLSIEFENDDMAHVQFDSQFSDYGSGAFSMQRLARPMLAECDG